MTSKEILATIELRMEKLRAEIAALEGAMRVLRPYLRSSEEAAPLPRDEGITIPAVPIEEREAK